MFKLPGGSMVAPGSQLCPPTCTARETIFRRTDRTYFPHSFGVTTRRSRRPVQSVVNWGSGNPRREFLHVDDLASACLHLLDNYDGASHVNVGTGEDHTIREIASIVTTEVGYTGETRWDTSKPDGTMQKLLDVSMIRETRMAGRQSDCAKESRRRSRGTATTSVPYVPESLFPSTHFAHSRESRSSNMSTRIAVFGTGYLGATHAACMAELGHEVLGVDVDAAKLEKLAAGEVPFYEPGLGEVLRNNIDRGRLKFTSSYEEAAEICGRVLPRGRYAAEKG